MLNFGHTVAHAIEAVAGYGGAFQQAKPWRPGWSPKAGWPSAWAGSGPRPTIAWPLARAVRSAGRSSGLDPHRLLERMGRDKKNRRGKVRFVLPRSIGRVELTDAATADEVHAVLSSLCE